jgi:23S rRNA (cytidine1920-2'-O)/16S rRNA (cytidine1409-2'-O)-methyltransferase
MSSIRLDKLVAERKNISRERGALLIKSGLVKVQGETITKPSFLLSTDSEILVTEDIHYVSRGYLKIKEAVEKFKLNLKDKKVLDVGASTGGFTQFILEQDAESVVAIDVGRDQMVDFLRNHPKVKLIEEINIKDFPNEIFDFVFVDISFISLTKVSDKLVKLIDQNKNGKIVCLVKPQFELGNMVIGKKGIVKDRKKIISALKDVIMSFNMKSVFLKDITLSPILGKTGNIEILALFEYGTENISIEKLQFELEVL